MERFQDNPLVRGVWFLVLASCGTPQPNDPKPGVTRNSHLEVEIRYNEPPSQQPQSAPPLSPAGERLRIPAQSKLRPQDILPVEGMLVDVKVHIKNISKDFLMLTALKPHDPTETEFSWQFEGEGELTYTPAEDVYVFQRRKFMTTPPYFNGGLLAPGERISMIVRTRAMNLPKKFTLDYRLFTIAELIQHVYAYFPSESREAFRFQRVRTRLPSDPISDPQDPGPALRTVIYPPSILQTSARLELSVNFPYDRNPVSPDSALKAAGAPPGAPYTYFESGHGWMIQTTPDSLWYVGQYGTQRVAALPLTMFYLVDVTHTKIEIEFLDETQQEFVQEYPSLAYADVSGQRHHMVFLDGQDILAFLKSAGGKNVRLELSAIRTPPRVLVGRKK